MEVYFRIYETPQKEGTVDETKWDLNYPQLSIHFPTYKVQGEQPLWDFKRLTGTVKPQQANLDISDLNVSRPISFEYPEGKKPVEKKDKEHITISPNMNEVKRYAQIVLDNVTARKLAKDILKELETE